MGLKRGDFGTALPAATRHVSLLTQLLDSKLSPATFESDFNTWETIKNRYEQQVGTPLPDGVLVAPLLNKTTGALQQHLRPNARTLQTSQQTRDTIVEHFRSKQLILGANSSSSNGPAPMGGKDKVRQKEKARKEKEKEKGTTGTLPKEKVKEWRHARAFHFPACFQVQLTYFRIRVTFSFRSPPWASSDT